MHATHLKAQSTLDTAWNAFLAATIVFSATLLPVEALAGDTFSETLCTVVGWFTGTVGTALATIAVLVVGIGALMGKVSWGMAILVAVGIAVIFGAPAIVEELGGTDGC